MTDPHKWPSREEWAQQKRTLYVVTCGCPALRTLPPSGERRDDCGGQEGAAGVMAGTRAVPCAGSGTMIAPPGFVTCGNSNWSRGSGTV